MSTVKKAQILINLLLSALVVLVFSYHWMAPLKEAQHNPAYSYKPIFYSAITGNDDYFYYSRIREFIDGSFFSGDHATIEHRHEFTPHASYSLSFFLGSLGGVLTGKTEHAYFFNYITYPLLTFWLVYYFSQLLGLQTFLGSALSLLVTLNTPSLFRTPNSLITSPLLLLVFIAFFLKFELKRPSRKLDILLVLLLGFSSITSMPNMFILYAAYCSCLVVYWRTLINRLGFLKIFGAALVLSLPGFYVILQNILGSNPDWFGLAIPPLERYSGFRQEYFYPVMLMIGKPSTYLLYLLIHFRHKRYVFSVLIAFVTIYMFINLTRGSFTSYYIFNRGGEIVFTFIKHALPFLVLDTIFREKEFRIALGKHTFFRLSTPWIKKIPSFALPVFFFLYLCTTVYRFFPSVYATQVAETTLKLPFYNRPEFNALMDWGSKNTNRNQVAVSADFDFNIHVGVYTPLCTYIPFAHHSPTTTLERHQRLFETFAFLGLSKNDVFEIFRNMKVRNELTENDSESDNQSALMQLLVFYGRHSHQKISEDEAITLANDYEAVRERFSKFTYKSDLFVLSRFTKKYVKPGSLAEKLLTSKEPVYKNTLYSVYSL